MPKNIPESGGRPLNILSPQVRKIAEGLGIDVLHGRHDPCVAEAARRTGLNLFAFPQWTGNDLEKLANALDEVVAEERAELDRRRRLAEAIRSHDVTTVGELPEQVVCDILGCTPDELPGLLDKPLGVPWWVEEARR